MTSNRRLPHVRAAIYGKPWMIEELELNAICEIVERSVAGETPLEFSARSSSTPTAPSDQRDGYQLVGSVGVIDLLGPIFPRANMLTKMSGATSCEEFQNNFSTAMNDGDVASILIRADSPGGAVTGIFETASLVYNSRNQGKDIVGLCEGVCASAAYLITSQANTVYATEASLVGSIGVVMQIPDTSRQQLNAGVDSRTIRTASLKAIGAGPVTDEQEAYMQELMDDYFMRFKDAVARARDGINIDTVSTGAMWLGSKAEAVGLIDGISSMDKIIEALNGG